jgi:hypothetical protein
MNSKGADQFPYMLQRSRQKRLKNSAMQQDLIRYTYTQTSRRGQFGKWPAGPMKGLKGVAGSLLSAFLSAATRGSYATEKLTSSLISHPWFWLRLRESQLIFAAFTAFFSMSASKRASLALRSLPLRP